MTTKRSLCENGRPRDKEATLAVAESILIGDRDLALNRLSTLNLLSTPAIKSVSRLLQEDERSSFAPR